MLAALCIAPSNSANSACRLSASDRRLRHRRKTPDTFPASLPPCKWHRQHERRRQVPVYKFRAFSYALLYIKHKITEIFSVAAAESAMATCSTIVSMGMEFLLISVEIFSSLIPFARVKSTPPLGKAAVAVAAFAV